MHLKVYHLTVENIILVLNIYKTLPDYQIWTS